MRPRTSLLGVVALLLTSSLAAPAHASFQIDSFSDVFPPSACLPDTHAPVVFLGRVCDGAACPPSSLRFSGTGSGCDHSNQSSLPGVIQGGSRELLLSSFNSMLALEVLPASHELEFRWGRDPVPSTIELYYAWPNPIDFPADAIDRLKLSLSGNVTPSEMVAFEIHIGDTSGHDWLTLTAASGPGVLELPLAEFTNPDPDFDFHHVSGISILIETCASCVGVGSHPAGSFRLGPPFLASALPTPVSRRSWGQVKSIYR